MKRLILFVALALASVGCKRGHEECVCPEVKAPAAVQKSPATPTPIPIPGLVEEPVAEAPPVDEIGWDRAQRLLKPLGRELEYVKLALQPERLAEFRASDFHAFALATPGILLYVAEFPTPEVAAARAGVVAEFMRAWGLMRPLAAALNENLVLVTGVGAQDEEDEAARELCLRAAKVFGVGVEVLPAETAVLHLPSPDSVIASPTPVFKEVELFLSQMEGELLQLWIAQERAHWVGATHITHDTELLAAQADERVMEFMTRKAAEATVFRGFDLSELAPRPTRKLHLLRIANLLPAPADSGFRAELARIAASMNSTYGKGKYCPPTKDGETPACLTIGDMSEVMAKSRDPEVLEELWNGWRTFAFPMKEAYVRYVEIANMGAREVGFENLGDLWKSGYDMPPADFQAETERLWLQLEPFYKDLHCYVRGRLRDTYGPDLIPADGPIPAHLLGNMWAQDWTNIYDLVRPEPDVVPFDLTQTLVDKGFTPRKMVETAESFFVSLGLPPLPETFWERSMLVKPTGREVVCHASAWDVDWADDLRIKMCIRINEEDFTAIHHELGHNYFQRAYKHQPTLFTNSANDGFHEALGDTIFLSVTPAYLKQIGLMPAETEVSTLNPLMKKALEKIAFLPFGLLIDRWRWEVFAGNIKPEDYNEAWWEMRLRYQGIAPPGPRPADAFDPGAKYHIPANVPYTRYFLASVLQFEFHRALCKIAGHEGPLHTCSIFGSEAAGARLGTMMSMGLSEPWPVAHKVITGQNEMDAGAILVYFEPLSVWLKSENVRRGYSCGW